MNDTIIQCTSLMVEKASVASDMILRFTAHNQVTVQAREPTWLWNPWGWSHEVQYGGNQWPHKMDLGPSKIKKKQTMNDSDSDTVALRDAIQNPAAVR